MFAAVVHGTCMESTFIILIPFRFISSRLSVGRCIQADRLLELGFEAEVSELIKNCPVGRQTLLFSATMNTKVDGLVKLALNRPVRVMAAKPNTLAQRLTQEFIRIRSSREIDR